MYVRYFDIVSHLLDVVLFNYFLLFVLKFVQNLYWFIFKLNETVKGILCYCISYFSCY